MNVGLVTLTVCPFLQNHADGDLYVADDSTPLTCVHGQGYIDIVRLLKQHRTDVK